MPALTVRRKVVRVLSRGATSLQLSTGGRVDGDCVGPEEGVKMGLRVLAGEHDGVDVLVHEHFDINICVCHGLRGETEKNEKHPVQMSD